jgi:hypothetical protein
MNQEDVELFLDILEFMGEEAPFLNDYLEHRHTYAKQILSSYVTQHGSGGSSSSSRPKGVYYTEGKSAKLLRAIDRELENMYPTLWNKYLKRFETEIGEDPDVDSAL